jgi:hypothetical protein
VQNRASNNNLLFNYTLFHISKKLPILSAMSSGKEEIISAMEQFERVQENICQKLTADW